MLAALLLAFGELEPSWAQEAEPQPGFPITYEEIEQDLWSPTVADVDGDGLPEIIVKDHHTLSVYKCDGTQLPGWPVTGFFESHPAMFGDIDGDGEPEIVLHRADISNWAAFGAYTPAGEQKAGWPFAITGACEHTQTALCDLDGDGALDIVAMGCSHPSKIYAYRGDGTVLPGWPVSIWVEGLPEQPDWGIGYFGSFAVGDVDFDGASEVAVGILYYNNADQPVSTPGILLDGDGTYHNGWPVMLVENPNTLYTCLHDPIIADLNGDYSCEVFGADSLAFLYGLRAEGEIFFPHINALGGSRPIACGNVDDDEDAEIIYNTFGALYVFDLTHYELWSDIDLQASTEGSPYTSFEGASVGDVDGDGAAEILIWSRVKDGNNVAAVHLYNGNLEELPGWPKEPGTIASILGDYPTTCLADLDGDNDLEAIYSYNDTLYVWSVPNPSGNPVRVDWAMRGHDATQGGFYHAGNLPPQKFLRGDCNRDEEVGVSDVVFLGECLFGDTETDCRAALDIDADSQLGIVDLLALASFLFIDGAAPTPPFPECGEKPQGETLPCVQFVCP